MEIFSCTWYKCALLWIAWFQPSLVKETSISASLEIWCLNSSNDESWLGCLSLALVNRMFIRTGCGIKMDLIRFIYLYRHHGGWVNMWSDERTSIGAGVKTLKRHNLLTSTLKLPVWLKSAFLVLIQIYRIAYSASAHIFCKMGARAA